MSTLHERHLQYRAAQLAARVQKLIVAPSVDLSHLQEAASAATDEELADALTPLMTAVEGKADRTELQAKADTAAVVTMLATKADDTALDAVTDALAAKADVTALEGKANVAVRETRTISRTAVAAGTTVNGTATLGASYRLYRLVTNDKVRLRLYDSDASRTADAARAVTDAPAATVGLMLDYVTEGAVNAPLAPPVEGFVEGGASAFYALTNLGTAAADLTATLTYMRTEQ